MWCNTIRAIHLCDIQFRQNMIDTTCRKNKRKHRVSCWWIWKRKRRRRRMIFGIVQGRIFSKRHAEAQALLKWRSGNWIIEHYQREIEELGKLLETFLVRDQRIFILFELERFIHFRLNESTLDPSNYILGSIPCRIIVTMGGTIRILPPGSILITSLLYSIGTWPIKPIGWDALYIPATITLHTDSVATEASRLEKQNELQENSRKKSQRLFHCALPQCHRRSLKGGRGVQEPLGVVLENHNYPTWCA